jgi:hypothetical protein
LNNGARKGGAPETLDVLKRSPGFQGFRQLHYSYAGGGKKAPADFIANLQEPCEAKLINVTVRRDGSFTVTNARNGFSKTYEPR